jgi:hypothetical protein
MRPGHIKVFDGLRVTTEHMDHLQGAMHSALQEIREILGLGRVYFGFEVKVVDERSITIMPGLAFDRQGNRLACDEPKTLPLTFEPGEEAKFVCLKYDQVEDGQVEGHFTIIWDNCSIILRSEVPELKENLLPIAKVIKSSVAGERLKVVSLITPEANESPAEIPGQTSAEDATAVSEVTVAGQEPAVVDVVGDAPAPVTEGTTGAAANVATAVDEKKSEPTPVVITAPEVNLRRLQIRQGIVRLTAENGSGGDIRGILLGSLKKKLNGGEPTKAAEMMFPMVEHQVALDFPVSSLSLHTIINAEIGVAGAATEEGQTITNLKCQATSSGEASFTTDATSQFGVSMIQASPVDETVQWTGSASELTENGIAHLPFSALWKGIERRIPEAANHPFEQVQLLIRTDRTNGDGFKVITHLYWKGEITEEIIQSINEQNTALNWEILLSWKAIGESTL